MLPDLQNTYINKPEHANIQIAKCLANAQLEPNLCVTPWQCIASVIMNLICVTLGFTSTYIYTAGQFIHSVQVTYACVHLHFQSNRHSHEILQFLSM